MMRPWHWIRGVGRRARVLQRRRVNRQAGFALLVITVSLAVLGAVVGEFGYNTRVELETAQNARDQLRAEYLARSAVNLSRLLIKVQQSVLDKNRQFVGDIQLAEFAPYLMKAFGGAADERAGLGELIGVDTSAIKGLGVGKGASFDVEMSSEDGKINVNCGGGLNPTGNTAVFGAGGGLSQQTQSGQSSSGSAAQPITNPAQALYTSLTALFFPVRYNRLFETQDADGQYVTRDETARAILDWSDVNEQRFEPVAQGTGGEDYRYDARRDSYKARNNYYDTVEELRLVRGMKDDVYSTFAGMLTVYGKCQVNLNAVTTDNWPILAALVRASAKNPQDPLLLDEQKVAALAQQIRSVALFGGVQSVDQFAQFISSGGQLSGLAQPGGKPGDTTATQQQQSGPRLPGIDLDTGRLRQLATVGPRQIYRIEATGTIERPGKKHIQARIHAVFDTQHFNQNTVSNDASDRTGTWVYWRME